MGTPTRPALTHGLFLAGLLGLAPGCELSGCGSESSAAATSAVQEDSTATERSEAAREALESLETRLDLTTLAHLADVYRRGLFMDFGTPARMKYTGGTWQNHWGTDGTTRDGRTFTRMGAAGRIAFPLARRERLRIRLRLKRVAAPQLVVYMNGETVRTVDLRPGVRTYQVPVAAAMTRAGENTLRLRATATNEEGVSVELDWARVATDADDPAKDPEGFELPSFGALVDTRRLGSETRSAVVAPAGTMVTWHIEVPQAGALYFALGAEGLGAQGPTTEGAAERSAPSPTNTRAEVFITPADGARTRVLSETATGTWQDRVVSLERWAGKVVRLDLESHGVGTVLFGLPKVLAPRTAPVEAPEPARSAIVLVIDTLRASKLRSYNPHSRVQTPVLDAFAREAVLFERAQSPENWTKPAVASLLTSLSPTTHGTKEQSSSLPDSALTLGEVYRAGGFRTAAFLANGYVSDRFGFAQGWDHYTNYIRENRNSRAEVVFDEAARWIERHREDRFFVYIQTIDPHVPYDPPDEFLRMYDRAAGNYHGQVRNRQTGPLLERAKRVPPDVTFDEADQQRIRDLHDGEISYHDMHMGRFLERLRAMGLYDELIFVVTADHGEEFGEHGSWGHGHSIFQELLHVPLLVRWPAGHEPGVRVSDTVSTLHIGPTVLEANGLDIPAVFEGRSMLDLMRGRHWAQPAVAFSEFLEDRRVVVGAGHKFVLRGNLTWAMFDLTRDPGEQDQLDVSDANPIAQRYLRVLLGQYLGASNRGDWLASGGEGPARVLPAQDSRIDAELCRQLQQLGYVDGRCAEFQ